MSFTEKVYKVVKKIPKGKVSTYKEVSRKAGNEKACQAVGNILHNNKYPEIIPCHRVIKSNLKLANNYAFGGYGVQKNKLISEGIKFNENDEVIFD